MEWYSNPLFVAITSGVIANILSPVVSRWLVDLWRCGCKRTSELSQRALEFRLKQLEEDRRLIIELKNNPARLVNFSVTAVMPLLFLTWVLVVVVFYTYILMRSELSKPYLAALAGLMGLGSRFLTEAMIACSLISKVYLFDDFEKENTAKRLEIEALLASRGVDSSNH